MNNKQLKVYYTKLHHAEISALQLFKAAAEVLEKNIADPTQNASVTINQILQHMDEDGDLQDYGDATPEYEDVHWFTEGNQVSGFNGGGKGHYKIHELIKELSTTYGEKE